MDEDLLLDLRYLETLRKHTRRALRKIAIYMLLMFIVTYSIIEITQYKLWLVVIIFFMFAFWLFFYNNVSNLYIKEFREIILNGERIGMWTVETVYTTLMAGR